MYRNTYLQMYKTASSHDSSITFMFAHFTQIYNTLGCVLQDLEYQMGKLLIQQQDTPTDKIKESYEQCIRPKQKIKEKEVIKIEESQAEIPSGKARQVKQFEIQSNQSKPRSIKQNNEKKVSNPNGSSQARINQKNKQIKPLNLREATEEKVQIFPVQNTRKTILQPIGSDSFESFFLEPKKTNRQQLSQKKSQKVIHDQQEHVPNEIQNPVYENTYDDFLDRFFKEDKSKKHS